MGRMTLWLVAVSATVSLILLTLDGDHSWGSQSLIGAGAVLGWAGLILIYRRGRPG